MIRKLHKNSECTDEWLRFCGLEHLQVGKYSWRWRQTSQRHHGCCCGVTNGRSMWLPGRLISRRRPAAADNPATAHRWPALVAVDCAVAPRNLSLLYCSLAMDNKFFHLYIRMVTFVKPRQDIGVRIGFSCTSAREVVIDIYKFDVSATFAIAKNFDRSLRLFRKILICMDRFNINKLSERMPMQNIRPFLQNV